MRLLRCARFESDKIKEVLNPPEYKTETRGFIYSRYEPLQCGFITDSSLFTHSLLLLGQEWISQDLEILEINIWLQ